MFTNYLAEAIWKLRPGSEFSFNEQDYSTVKFDKIEGNPPTQLEIDAAIEQVKADEVTAKTKAAADKATAEAKLAALGLTADDLKALGLGSN
jgi:hypothetical protein